jgi:hypothetical protein
MKALAFGDSWGYGWAGQKPNCEPNPRFTETYSKILAEKLGYSEFINHSMCGFSMGIILEHFYLRSASLNEGDLVIVTIPPDSRFYLPYSEEEGVPDMMKPGRMKVVSATSGGGARDDWLKMIEYCNADPYWFEFHIGIGIQAISDACDAKGVKCILQHNYGILRTPDWCDNRYVLNTEESMWDMLGLPPQDIISDPFMTQIKADGPYDPSCGGHSFQPLDRTAREALRRKMLEHLIYIEGSETLDLHPNEKAHTLLGQKLYELCNK